MNNECNYENEPWKLRLANEFWELDKRIDKLSRALNECNFSRSDLYLLDKQLSAMNKYLLILRRRALLHHIDLNALKEEDKK